MFKQNLILPIIKLKDHYHQENIKDQLGGEIITIFVALRPKIETKKVRTGCCSVSKVK